MQQYLTLLQHILDHGVKKATVPELVPLVILVIRCGLIFRRDFHSSHKKLHTKSIIHELLWFLKGETNIAYLKENGVSIWNEWANEEGDLGPVYGKQWRSWEGANGQTIDQIADVVNQIQKNT